LQEARDGVFMTLILICSKSMEDQLPYSSLALAILMTAF